MNRLLYLLASFGLLATMLAGCTPTGTKTPTGTAATPMQTASPQPQAADDLIFTPAGVIMYRANLNAPNQWPAIPTVTKTFVSGSDTISVTYRDYIETNAGQTRNDIISIFDSVGQIRYNQIGPNLSPVASIDFTVVSLPTGITADTGGPIQFHIANDVSSAEYDFQINVQIDGILYTLPCTIKVP